MSRSRKGRKGIGYEVTRKPEGKSGYRSPGRLAKDLAHAHSRHEDKRLSEVNTKDTEVDAEDA